MNKPSNKNAGKDNLADWSLEGLELYEDLIKRELEYLSESSSVESEGLSVAINAEDGTQSTTKIDASMSDFTLNLHSGCNNMINNATDTNPWLLPNAQCSFEMGCVETVKQTITTTESTQNLQVAGPSFLKQSRESKIDTQQQPSISKHLNNNHLKSIY